MIDFDDRLSRAGRKMQQSEIRKMGTLLAEARNLVSFAPGYPDPAAFPWDELQEIASELLSSRHAGALQYGPTRGHRPLLDAIAGLLDRRHIVVAPDNLQITTGSQQGLDLLARVLLDPGDVVLVELPAYAGAITAFRNAQAELVGVRQDPDGIDLDHLEATTVQLRREGRCVRLLYVVPNFQNPTGLLLARLKRAALLEWAARHDLLIVEDDPYGDLYFEDRVGPEDTRPIAADDCEGRVIYLSSFSKALAPGLRTAWMAAPAPLASRIEVAKQATDLCTSTLDQHIVYEACRRGVIDRQLPRLRRHYQRKRDVMLKALREQLSDTVSWIEPLGGFFLWVRLPAAIDAEAMLERAVRHGVIYVAGGAFFVDGSGRETLRLSFSLPPAEAIEQGVSRLASAVREEVASEPAVRS